MGVLKKKTNALCVRLQLRRVGLKDEVRAPKREILIDRNFDG